MGAKICKNQLQCQNPTTGLSICFIIPLRLFYSFLYCVTIAYYGPKNGPYSFMQSVNKCSSHCQDTGKGGGGEICLSHGLKTWHGRGNCWDGEDIDVRPRWFIRLAKQFNTSVLICGCSSCPIHLDQYGCQCYGLKLLLDAHYEAKLNRSGGVGRVLFIYVCVVHLWVHFSEVSANKRQGHEVVWVAEV